MKALLMILIFFPGVLSAQVELDLQLCREMAIRNSKEMEIADRQHRKAMFDTKSYRADYLPKLSAVGVGFYNQKKYNYKLKGGYLPTYKPGENGQLEPNVMIDPETQKPVIGSDGNPVFNEYAFLPDIRLQLKLRGVYMAGAQLEQPVYLGGKVRAAHRMAQLATVESRRAGVRCREVQTGRERTPAKPAGCSGGRNGYTQRCTESPGPLQ